jgi:hypothetical protein
VEQIVTAQYTIVQQHLTIFYTNTLSRTMSTLEEKLLDWTSKQGRILTANGKATEYYTSDRGFPFEKDSLPHHHLLTEGNATFDKFYSWANQQQQQPQNPVCGAWNRPLFVGGWEHSTDEDEEVYNVQTNTLFIDIRIPRLAKKLILYKPEANFGDKEGSNALHQFSDDQLRLYARRHAFAGYAVLEHEDDRPVCTRHHCIDWNFVGAPRPRPNKWFIEMHPDHTDTWKEWSYAKDDFAQHYYWERWERLPSDFGGNGLVLALRMKKDQGNNQRDGIIVAVGDHFNYIFARDSNNQNQMNYGKGSLVDVVDAAIDANDRECTKSYLSIDAGHGSISKGWIIDSALQYWKIGTSLFANGSISVDSNMDLFWKDTPWVVHESSVASAEDLAFLLHWGESYHTKDECDRVHEILKKGAASEKSKL